MKRILLAIMAISLAFAHIPAAFTPPAPGFLDSCDQP